ncbi:MAG: DUF885 family protein, partial [Pseudomonadales bacterium]
MRWMQSATVPALLLVSALGHAEVSVRNAEAAKLHQVFDHHWNRVLEENPVWASYLGDRRFNRQWRDLSPAAREKNHAGDLGALEDLRNVDRELLTADDRLNYDLFERDYRDRIEAHQFDMYLIPVSQRGGIQTLDEVGDQLRMSQVSDYEDWLTRL